jgi:hypothetical protein
MAEAETGEGWLVACDEADRFLAVNRELIAVLVERLNALSDQSVVEVCAGDGQLADALNTAGASVLPTDADADRNGPVRRMSAPDALARFQPRVVLGCFVPADAGVDEAVFACASVQHYLVLNARLGGSLGSPALWNDSRWRATPLEDVRRWMLTRHDVWLGVDEQGRMLTIPHGEAWHFERIPLRNTGALP